MVEINFMPWRTQKIIYERKKMMLLIGVGAVLAMILLMIVHILLSRQLDRDEDVLRQLGAALPSVTGAMHDTQSLSLDGVNVTMLLNLIAQSTVNGVCYQQLRRDESGWQLTGQALSVAALSSAWRSLAAAIFFKNSVVNALQKDAAHDYFQFIIRVPSMQSGREE